ncbi:MAG: Methanol oxidation protein [Verrucomicrobiales bacterium]|nr:Methanol oxidation protein [Verrucomicrobiales bacterium]
MTRIEPIGQNIWLLRYPLSLLGVSLGRNVTIMRLVGGELIIHSTAPFTAEDVVAIRALGEPGWLVEATLFHDTFAKQGRQAFPALPYLAPEAFAKSTGLDTYPFDEILPAAWGNEISVLKLEGIPKLQEIVMLHRPSRTLIVADLVFNWGPTDSWWENFVRRRMMGIARFPGMSRLFRMNIRNHSAFANSVDTMLSWDFDRLVVAHGEVISTGAKRALSKALGR